MLWLDLLPCYLLCGLLASNGGDKNEAFFYKMEEYGLWCWYTFKEYTE